MWRQLQLHPHSREAGEIRRFLRLVAVFLLLPTLTYLPIGFIFSEAIMERAFGPSMRKQVHTSFENALLRDYDLLLIGNSRMYRGLNPDKFSLLSYNFSHDNDSYNQIYHKLRWLDEQGKTFKFIALGVDYFQFSFIDDRRNHAYGELLGDAYLSDYDPYPWYSRKRWFAPGYARGMNPQYLLTSTDNRCRLKPNGQYIVPGAASPDDKVLRESSRLDIQMQYFERILQHCESRGVKVFLCMLPIRPEESNAYRPHEIGEFHEFLSAYIDGKSRVLIDDTYLPGYSMQDFADITHLNPISADRYSSELSEIVASLIDEKPPGVPVRFTGHKVDRLQTY